MCSFRALNWQFRSNNNWPKLKNKYTALRVHHIPGASLNGPTKIADALLWSKHKTFIIITIEEGKWLTCCSVESIGKVVGRWWTAIKLINCNIPSHSLICLLTKNKDDYKKLGVMPSRRRRSRYLISVFIKWMVGGSKRTVFVCRGLCLSNCIN